MDLITNLTLGFGVAFTPINLMYAFIGCLLGTLIGVLPGIGPLATIAMLLPATYALPPVSALIMLAGIYYGAQYGGSTTAILVNLPGESSSVVTVIDGYQMARQGRAGPALAAAGLASSEPQAVVDHYVRLFTAIGSPGYPVPESDMRERILRGVERSFHPVGSLRQMLAIISDNCRAEQLSRIKSPTLVLHGRADPLVPFAHGEDTAKRITGARLVGFDGMGHDLPPEPVALMLDELIPHIQAAEPPASYLAT